ncbi:hypothetical protein HYU06_02070 [Candidatus Woesearchaeota archaeon]|nr:hypothetical protein [Candidatus Woesearchaeota archaeon]
MAKILLEQAYTKFHEAYGPQGWWPVAEENSFVPTYHKADYSYPQTEKQEFEIILGAILTQNTSWKNVEKAIIALHKNNLVDINKIAKVDQKKLALLIKSAGYFNQKAERLKIIAGYIKDKYAGKANKLFDKQNSDTGIAELRDELLAIKGIGPETADSIILYAAKKPVFVVDAYTKRIFARIGLLDENNNITNNNNTNNQNQLKYDEIQKLFHDNLTHDRKLFNEYHALIVEHAKQHCKVKPICKQCPLLDVCEYERKIL